MHKEVLAGVTNPSKLKQAVESKRLLKKGGAESGVLSKVKDDD